MNKFYTEILRKLVHLSSLWISILYFYTDKELMLSILIPLSILVLIIDLSRRFISPFHHFINNIIGNIMRDEEKKNIALVGATYLVISSALTIFLFSKEIAIFALSVLSISDACAALIGKRFGKTKLIGEKSLEGSVTFFVSAVLVGLALIKFYSFSFSIEALFFSSLAATLIELFAKKMHIDDNFTIPLVIGIVFTI